VMLVRHHMEIAGIRLEARLIDGDDQLMCDAEQIEQALVALLINAVEAMPDGGSARVVAAAETDTLSLSVSDSGCGIADDTMPHIFEPFFSTKAGAEGAGLGLAVVYGIVERHGGSISVDSKVNQGTTFRIVLPRRPPGEPGVEREHAEQEAG